jgi:predicted nucleic acid-binding protein
MKYVVDASFVASLFLPDEASQSSDEFAKRMVKHGATAPGLLQIEMTNILLMAERRRRINGMQLKQLSDAFDILPIMLQPPLIPEQRAEVLRLAQKHTLTAYDATYLELSMRLGLELGCFDKSLVAAAKVEGLKIAIS